MANEQLAHIASVRLGRGGYQDAMFGVSFTFRSGSMGVGDFWGFWDWSTPVSERAQWNEADRIALVAEWVERLAHVMRLAQKEEVHDLVGVPVALSFERGPVLGGQLTSWRVLTEVIPNA